MLPAKAVKSFLLPEYDRIITNWLQRGYSRTVTTFPPPTLSRDFMEAWKAWVAPNVDLSAFPYWYVGCGSSELLRALAHHYYDTMAGRAYSAQGDFEGWVKFAEFAGFEPAVVKPERLLHWYDMVSVKYFSNPSAANGNWFGESHPLFTVETMLREASCLVDMAYMGTTAQHRVDVSGAEAVTFSISKSLGMFAHRLGIMFTKFEMPELEYNNKFLFPVIPTHLAMEIIAQYPVDYAHYRMKGWQERAIEYFNDQGFRMEASDSYLLAFAVPQMDDLPGYMRNEGSSRYCLTPYYERMMCGLGESL